MEFLNSFYSFSKKNSRQTLIWLTLATLFILGFMQVSIGAYDLNGWLVVAIYFIGQLALIYFASQFARAFYEGKEVSLELKVPDKSHFAILLLNFGFTLLSAFISGLVGMSGTYLGYSIVGLFYIWSFLFLHVVLGHMLLNRTDAVASAWVAFHGAFWRVVRKILFLYGVIILAYSVLVGIGVSLSLLIPILGDYGIHFMAAFAGACFGPFLACFLAHLVSSLDDALSVDGAKEI